MTSEGIVNLIGTALKFGCRPSMLLGVDDEYTSYCLDEACAFIATKMENGDEPTFRVEYKSFSDVYKRYS